MYLVSSIPWLISKAASSDQWVHRFWSDSDRFCRYLLYGKSAKLRTPFTSMGVVAEGASCLFPRIVGPQWANWILQSSSWLAED